MNRETFLDLLPAYALGALDADEKSEVEAQLANDTEAQALLAEYQVLTQSLVLTAPAREAPPHLSDDLRQRLASRGTHEAAVSPRPQWWRRWLAVAAILAVVFGITWGLTLLQPPASGSADGEVLYTQLNQLENTMRIALTARDNFEQVTGELVADPYTNRAVIHVYGLPELTEAQTYQLWLNGPGGVVSGGLFQPQPSGTATNIVLPLEADFAEYNSFGVSLEPAGGSPLGNRRSGPGVFGVSLDSA